MKRKSVAKLLASLTLVALAAIIACAPKAAPAPVAPATPIATTPPTAPAAPAQAKAATEQEWDKVVAAARKEGTVNFYTTFAPPEFRVAMSKAMKENYGINMEWLVAPGATNAERIRVEQRAKQYVADVWFTGFSVLLTKELRGINALKPFNPPVVTLEPGIWRGKGIDSITDERDAITIGQRTSVLFVINTNMVRSEETPKSYKDLLDPKWKGRIVMHDPTVPGAGSIIFWLLKKEYGLEYWEKMKEQNIMVIRDYGEVARRVSVGEAYVSPGSLGIPHIMPFLVAGAPVKILSPTEGGYRTNSPMYLTNNAPHPNAAKVVINWALTKEGQDIISRLNGDEPIRTDVEYRAHPLIDNANRGMTKWLVGEWKVVEEIDADVAAGTARKALGLK